jgi:biopolymer transport protein TolQ
LIDIMSQASPVAIFTLLILLFFSIATWTIIVLKIRQIRSAQRQTVSFLEAFWKAKSLSQIQNQIKEFATSPVAEIFRVGYNELAKITKLSGGLDGNPAPEGITFTGLDNLRRALGRSGRAEMTKLSQSLTFLATTGNIAPFIGLFGTVVGIMNAFTGIGAQGSASLATVAPGIAEALVATAAGLAAAIPAVIAYNLFLSRIKVLEAEMNAFAADFLNLVERDAMRKAQARRAG